MTDLPTLEAALKLADQDCPLPSLAGPALKVLRETVEGLQLGLTIMSRRIARQDDGSDLRERSTSGRVKNARYPADSATLTALIAELRAREALGRAKYGTDVDRTDLTNGQWRQHLREELMDALLYNLAEERTAPTDVSRWSVSEAQYGRAIVALRETLAAQDKWISMETTYAVLDAIGIVPGWNKVESVECGGEAPPVYASGQGLCRDVGAMQWSFQQRVAIWMKKCFGEVEALAADATDPTERNHRFLEEALELVQACGCTASEAHQLVDYVFGRPVGDKSQEVGGVMVTLAALCQAQGLDMRANGETELARIWTKVEQIRAKHAAKPKHSPLPGQTPIYGIDLGTDDKTVEAFGHIDSSGKLHLEQFLESEPNSPNSGHGHVRPRPDGMVAKCGGPMLCRVCAQELAGMLEIPGAGKCWCLTCHPQTWTNRFFVVCPTCGNKRCPHAHDHRNACTGSNAVGQPGSSWEHVKPIIDPEPGEPSC